MQNKLTKALLASYLQKQHNLSGTHANRVVNAFLETITHLAQKEGGVTVKNLGKFTFKNKKITKNIRNFANGESSLQEVTSSGINFTPSKNLKKQVF